MKVKIEWEEFVDMAFQAVKEIHPTAKEETMRFMKPNYSDSDSEVYEVPTYIEIEI